jgi:hypothetical protein
MNSSLVSSNTYSNVLSVLSEPVLFICSTSVVGGVSYYYNADEFLTALSLFN